MTLRPAGRADVPAVAALDAALFGPDAWSEAAVLGELEGPGRHAVVVVEGGHVVGYVVAMTSGDVTDLQRIAVHPAHRRRGLARSLLGCVLDHAHAVGTDRMLLEVSAANASALTFYARAGFVEIARRRGYYRDGNDAVVLARPVEGDRATTATAGEDG